jgi:hypothetical protein
MAQMPNMAQMTKMIPNLSKMGALSTASSMMSSAPKSMSMGCPPCERGSRVLIYLSIITLAILILVFSATESFGLNLLWMSCLLVGYIICTFIFL